MYEGQAKIKLYEDLACTKEYKLTPSGGYSISIPITTGHSSGVFVKNICMKNVGTHTAYNIKAEMLSDSSGKCTITAIKDTMLSNRRDSMKLSIPYTKGDKGVVKVELKIGYDNIP